MASSLVKLVSSCDIAQALGVSHTQAMHSAAIIEPPSSSPQTATPDTWLLMGHKAGDNAQITALAEGLGWPVTIKNLTYRKTEIVTNLLAGPTTMGLIPDKSDPLEPPWPDLVISAGRRNEPLARWIQQQAGGPTKTKLVHVGRPWANLVFFDLIVTTPQYRLPERPNILHNEAPLHRVTNQRLDDGQRLWKPRLAHLPKPYVAVVIGGHSGPYNFDTTNGALLAHHASRYANDRGGSLLVTTSARTPKSAMAAFEQHLSAPAQVFHWQPDARENPYFAFLALAEYIIVTGDSMSMLIEACVTRKPVMIFDLDDGPSSKRPPFPKDGSIKPPSPMQRLREFRMQPVWFRLSKGFAPRRLTRDVSVIHRRQVEAGRAVWLGEPWPAGREPPPLQDRERAATRVRELMGMTSIAPTRSG